MWLAKCLGRSVGLVPKGTLHRVHGSKPTLDGNLLYAFLAILQQTFRGFDSQARDEPRRRGAVLAREGPGKIANTHAQPGSELIDAQRLVQIFNDPDRQFTEWNLGGTLERQRGTKLVLAAGPADEKDQSPGHPKRDVQA